MIDAIGQALAAACGNRAVLGRIGGVLGEAARAGLAQDQAQRAAAIAAARAPVPPGLRGIDPSWIEVALAELPDRARVALAEGPLSELDVWLVRRACAQLVPLPPIEATLARPRVPADVLRMSVPALRGWLAEVGRDQLAFALGEHAAALGASLVPVIARIARAPRHGELGPRRAAVARAQGEPFVIGVRTVAPHLEPILARGLVLRFSHPEGLALAIELTAHRASPTAAWATVIAPPR
ncbi:MAG: hypothetical protein IPQ07_28720 [Myxococcales bacterium]|nr:hypothetical protein [Myxococcales bacterium]